MDFQEYPLRIQKKNKKIILIALASIIICCLGAYLLQLRRADYDYSEYEKIVEKYENIKEKANADVTKKIEANDKKSDYGRYSKSIQQAQDQAVISKQDKKGEELSSNTLKYQGYIASESDTEDLKKFLDKNIGRVVELDLYYPESISLHQYDITGDTPVIRQLNLSSLSNSYVVDNAFSSWGKHHFIHSAGTIQVTNQQYSDYERTKGHLSFWMYENSHKNSMFIINIASESDQFIWQTSHDIDENIRNFNFNALNNGGEFKLMELYGSFKVESPVNSADFTNHEGYPTYPELWQEEDQDYIHFDPDGEPTDTVVYNLIPQ